MKTITATELARNLKQMLDYVEFRGEELAVIRNNQPVARIIPGVTRQTALEAMADLYRTLPDDAGRNWLAQSRRGSGNNRIRNPWRS